jgi:hypothetical protein
LATITGTGAGETLSGTSGDDTISGLGGNDILAGDGGADVLDGGDGDDTLYSGSITPPWERPFFQNNPDFVAPVLDRGSEVDTINGGAGLDRIFAGYGDIVDGGADLADLLISLGGASAGVTVDFRGLDNGGTLTIGGHAISNIRSVLWIEGSAFDDTITGSDQGDGYGSTYAPIFGLGGNDHLIAGRNTGNIYGGDGNDTIEVHQSSTGIGNNGGYYGDAGDDVINVSGDGATYPNASVFGGDGNDTITTAGSVSGGAGNDTISIVTNLFYQSHAYGDGGDDVINDSAAADCLYGGDGADALYGNVGNDLVQGDDGADLISGGDGSDTLTGGAGADSFRDTAAGLNGDTITDFAAGDRIIVADAALAGFTFSLSGNTLSYTGGSLTFGSAVTGTLVASAAPGGGVQLMLRTHDPANDFNGDGISDILWRHDGGTLGDWLGTGTGELVPSDSNNIEVANYWHVAGTGDFDGDGRDDILWRGDGGEIGDWLGLGSGGFVDNSPAGIVPVPLDWHVVGTGDFNGDGRDDILWRNDDGRIGDWLARLDGGFTANDPSIVGVSNDWHVIGTGDFNGDGRDDILWRSDGGQLGDWFGTDSGGFTPNPTLVGVPGDWHVVGTGDFNGDGCDDILWRSDGGQLGDWFGRGDGGFTVNPTLTAVPVEWNIAAVGDYNGDALDDILWRDVNGTVGDWLGQADGNFIVNPTLVGTPNDWHVQDQPHWLL